MHVRPFIFAPLLFALAACGKPEGVPSMNASRDASASADISPPDTAALYAGLDSLRRAHHIPGLAIAIVHDTSVVLSHAFGLADIARQIVVTPNTPFDIASVSKPISAVVALRLVQDGLLDLDRPMHSYRDYPEFCNHAKSEGGIFFSDFNCNDDQFTMRRVLSMSANGTPGTRFFYNPPSFSYASRPMAEVAGRPFSTLVDSLIFRPAGMQHSARKHRALPLPAELASALATPYHWDSAGKFVQSDQPPPQGDGAAGGVVSTVMDLARFDIALSNNRLISAEQRAKLFVGTTTPSGGMLPYGLGWFLGTYKGLTLAWHTGLWEGQYSALYLKVLSADADRRYAFILLANSDGLQWDTRLDEAAIERSPFARLLLETFAER